MTDTKSATLLNTVREHVLPKSIIFTDEYNSYDGISRMKEGYGAVSNSRSMSPGMAAIVGGMSWPPIPIMNCRAPQRPRRADRRADLLAASNKARSVATLKRRWSGLGRKTPERSRSDCFLLAARIGCYSGFGAFFHT
jgi:hypothetical protein